MCQNIGTQLACLPTANPFERLANLFLSPFFGGKQGEAGVGRFRKYGKGELAEIFAKKKVWQRTRRESFQLAGLIQAASCAFKKKNPPSLRGQKGYITLPGKYFFLGRRPGQFIAVKFFAIRKIFARFPSYTAVEKSFSSRNNDLHPKPFLIPSLVGTKNGEGC